MKIAGGFIGGLILGLIGVLVTMHLLTNDVTEKQAAAYDQGLRKGIEMASADMAGEAIDIGGALNRGMAEDNERMQKQLEDIKLRLQALNARADLPQDARDQLAEIVNAIE